MGQLFTINNHRARVAVVKVLAPNTHNTIDIPQCTRDVLFRFTQRRNILQSALFDSSPILLCLPFFTPEQKIIINSWIIVECDSCSHLSQTVHIAIGSSLLRLLLCLTHGLLSNELSRLALNEEVPRRGFFVACPLFIFVFSKGLLLN